MPIVPANNIEVLDEAITQGRVRTINFVGAGVVAAVVGTIATVTISGGVALPPTFSEFTVDLGASRCSGTFDITGLSGLVTDKPVQVWQTAAKITTKGDARDEGEMDTIQATGYVVSATVIRVYWWSPSTVVGTYAFGYLVGA